MNDLLSAALEATAAATRPAAPVVVGEQHDASAVNWVAGLSDPGEMIGCGRYQQLRRLAGETDDAYQTRLTALLPTIPAADRVKIETAMKAAALKRAGLDTSNDRVSVMVAGEPAWHGLGVNVRDAVSSADAIRLAGLDWRVGKVQLQYRNPVTQQMAPADRYGIVREDTGDILGTVGKQYRPFQNAEGFDFLDTVIGQFDAKYESAGAIYGGSKVWMLVHLPKLGFSVNGSDRVEPYAIFTNSHDGTEAAKCFPTSQRVVCANTFRLARNEGDKGIVMRHTSNLKARVAAAQTALGIAVQQFDRFQAAADQLAHKKVEPLPYFEGVLDAVCDVTAAEAAKGADLLAAALKMTDAERKTLARQIDKRKSLLDDLLERYESEKNGVAGMRGTGWAALNAVTEAVNHGPFGGRATGDALTRKSRRFESVIDGAADEIMQVAYSQAITLVS